MRKVLATTTLLWVTSLLCISAIHIFSPSMSPNEGIVRYLEANTQNISGVWCWIKICPYQTLFNQARSQVEQAHAKIQQDLTAGLWIALGPDTTLYFDSNDGSQTSPIAAITIYLRPHSISLGDALQLFGTPLTIRRDAENKAVWHRSICFKGGLCADFEGDKPVISPHMSLTGLSFLGSDERALKSVFRAWSGFVSLPLRN